jgi:hypothetical protein
MATLSDGMDRWMARFSQRLWWWLPTSGVIAVSGNALARVHNTLHLPISRKSTHTHSPALRAVRDFDGESVLPSVSGGQPSVSCSSPQYCNIHGKPCACCGGSDSSCPAGTQRGFYWSFCCSGRTIWFADCCGGSACPASCPFCTNSTQPNWCNGAGQNNYTCTLAEDHGACGY